MALRIPLSVAVLALCWATTSPARDAAPSEGAGRGGLLGPPCDCERCSPIYLEIEVRAGGAGIGAEDARIRSSATHSPTVHALDLAKGLATFPARIAQEVSSVVCFLREADLETGVWSWAKQGLIEPLLRLPAWHRQKAEVAQEVEVETALSVVGEAADRSLGATGWAVRTREHLWIREYRLEERAAEMPTLAINRGTQVAKADSEVVVFTSPASVPGTDLENPGLSQADAGEGMEITALRTEGNGVGFLVRISGPVTLHADDRDA